MIHVGDGVFVFGGTARYMALYPENAQNEAYIVKFRDPDLVGIECPEPYTILAAILSLPIYVAWRRTREARTPA
jgi:hypothetical protein